MRLSAEARTVMTTSVRAAGDEWTASHMPSRAGDSSFLLPPLHLRTPSIPLLALLLQVALPGPSSSSPLQV
jgi:hypothetical protein